MKSSDIGIIMYRPGSTDRQQLLWITDKVSLFSRNGKLSTISDVTVEEAIKFRWKLTK